MDNTAKKQSPTKTLLFGILMMAACVLSARFMLFPALLLPFVGAYATAKLPPSWSLVYYIAAAAACFIILRGIWIPASLMILLSSLLTGIAVKRKMRTYEGVLLSCIGWVLAFAVVIAASYIMLGTDPLTMIHDKILEAVEQSDNAAVGAYWLLNTPEMFFSASTKDALAKFTEVVTVINGEQYDVMRELVLSADSVATIKNFLALNIPTLALQYSLLGGLFSYLVARRRMKRTGEEVSPIPAFKDFKLPKGLATPLAIVFVLGLLALTFLDLPMQIYTALSILVDCCGLIFTIQAVTLIHWFISLRSKSRGATVALSIVIPLAGLVLNFLPWVGLFEMLFKLRYNVIIRDNSSQK